jgi:hypothetical protein
MLEWNLPPVRFSNVGTAGNFLSWARPALFAGILATGAQGNTGARTVQDVGFQVDFQFTVMNDQTMTLSVGSALGFGADKSRSSEWMVSLNVLR